MPRAPSRPPGREPVEDVLRSPDRRRLHDLVHAQPGITLQELARRLPTSPTNARYHLDRLARRGLVQATVVKHRLRFAPAGADLPRLRRGLYLAADPRLAALVRLAAADGTPAADLVARLRGDWGLSRSGAWKLLDRAVTARLLARIVRQGRLVLRPLPE